MAYGDPYEPLTDPAAYTASKVTGTAIQGLGLGALAGLGLKYHLNYERMLRGKPFVPGGNFEAMGTGAAIGGALGAWGGYQKARHRQDLLMAQSGMKMAMLQEAYRAGAEFAGQVKAAGLAKQALDPATFLQITMHDPVALSAWGGVAALAAAQKISPLAAKAREFLRSTGIPGRGAGPAAPPR